MVVASDGHDVITETRIDKDRFVIGKGEACDLRLKGWNISKEHATIFVDEDMAFIEDNGSIFGTWSGSARISRLGPLNATTEIRIGGYTLNVQSKSTEGAAQERDTTPGASMQNTQPASLRSSQAMPSPPLPPSPPDMDPVVIGPVNMPGRRSAGAVMPSSADTARNKEMAPAAYPLPEKDAAPKPVREIDHEFAKWRKTLHEAVLFEIDARRIDANKMSEQELRANVRSLIRELVNETFQLPPHIDAELISKEVMDEAIGLGPLEPMIADDTISEIMVNKFDEIWVEKSGRLVLSDATFTSDVAVMGAIERIVTPLGRRIDESSPMVDARLRDGSRVNAIVHPLSLRGPTLTIRKFSKKKIQANDLVRFNSLTPEMLEILQQAVLNRLNIVVSGGTGTGKTTFLNMVSSFVPDDERIVTIEDAAELQLSQPNLVSLESRPPNVEGKGMITIRDLVRNSLRMRPDRIIVGECRGGEALDMLQAMNTGHDGSMTTLHSNSPRDALARMEVLVLMAGMNLPVRAIREQIASAVHLIIQLTRFSCGARKVTAISEVVGIESETVQLQDIFVFERHGLDADGKTVGQFKYSDMVPQFMERARHG